MTLFRVVLSLGLAACGAAFAAQPPAGGRDQGRVVSLFISPCGQPFRAPVSEPYPVAAWFAKVDANHDGAIDKAELRAEAADFFKVLDRDHDGVISGREVAVYELILVPEIVAAPSARNDGAKLWLAQLDDSYDDIPTQIDPTPPSSAPRRPVFQGAAAYSLLGQPEPVTAADQNLDGRITSVEFLAASDRHFDTLDSDGDGKLTLDTLPETAVQQLADKMRSKLRRK